MSTLNSIETSPLDSMANSPVDAGSPNDLAPLVRRKRLPPTPRTPTPIRRSSQQPRKTRAVVFVKPRAASTSALLNTNHDEPSPSPPGAFPGTPGLLSTLDETTTRQNRGISEPLCTPDRPSINAFSSSHSEPVVVTQSTRKRRKTASEKVRPSTANEWLTKEIRTIDKLPSARDKSGVNYVLQMFHRNGSKEHFLKIGQTGETGDKRRKAIQKICGHHGFSVSIPCSVPSRFYKKAEQLIRIELSPDRYDFDCSCGAIHREYVKSHIDLARGATRRWTQFCESEPWDHEGNLVPFWEARLNKLEASGKLHEATPDQRARLWTDFVSLGLLEITWYNLKLRLWAAQIHYQVWLVLLLVVSLNAAMNSSYTLLCLNAASQLWVAWLHTFKDLRFATDKSLKRGKNIDDSICDYALPLSTLEPEPDLDDEAENLVNSKIGDSVSDSTDSMASKGNDSAEISMQNPLDLTASDVEI